MSLKESMDRLTASLGKLEAAAVLPSFDTLVLPPAIQQLRDEAHNLVQALADVGDSISTNKVILSDLTARLENDDLVGDLLSSIEAGAEESAERVEGAVRQFGELAEGLGTRLTDEVEDWFTNSITSLHDTLQASLDGLKEGATGGLEKLGDHAKESILGVGNSVVDRIEDRLRSAVGDVVEAATERALTEVVETMVNTQMGVMITSAIGPYVPVVIALKPALPAVQDALDIMRGGF
ncbi:MAG: hypothetical protein E5X49_17205 [Mesorhizobium sp.]|uniref:hypothetical protein n=1 Tax=Mesorhizobium sp. TaxID=1871066 RepID=UPI0011F85FCA|nr:hypothetical protein [Mesorhizobium sp.]TIQ41872.1 MAG: hypothetical protein E5X49_17205 [Mesorhizobium sp.]